jgi:hypothetical protein
MCAARKAKFSTSSSTCGRSHPPIFVTLGDGPELAYLIGASHTPNAEGGLRYHDPILGLDWSLPATVISERDTAWKPIVEIEDDFKSRMSIGEAAYG